MSHRALSRAACHRSKPSVLGPRQIAEGAKGDPVCSERRASPGIAKCFEFDGALGTIHRIQISRVSRVTAEFRETGKKLFKGPDEAVHSDALRLAGSGLILPIETTVIANPMSITSQRNPQLTRKIQKDRFKPTAAMDVLVRVQMRRLGSHQAAELGELAPGLVFHRFHVVLRDDLV